MKKFNLLVPSFIVITASPFIGLTSCFESKDDPTPPGPEPIPKDAIVLEHWNPNFIGFKDENDTKTVVTGGILTDTLLTYESGAEYSFAIKFQHAEEFFKYSEKIFSFTPSIDGESYSKGVFLFSDIEIYINTTDNKLIYDRDYRANDYFGAIDFYCDASPKVGALKNGDIIFIKAKLTSAEQNERFYFAFHTYPNLPLLKTSFNSFHH